MPLISPDAFRDGSPSSPRSRRAKSWSARIIAAAAGEGWTSICIGQRLLPESAEMLTGLGRRIPTRFQTRREVLLVGPGSDKARNEAVAGACGIDDGDGLDVNRPDRRSIRRDRSLLSAHDYT